MEQLPVSNAPQPEQGKKKTFIRRAVDSAKELNQKYEEAIQKGVERLDIATKPIQRMTSRGFEKVENVLMTSGEALKKVADEAAKTEDSQELMQLAEKARKEYGMKPGDIALGLIYQKAFNRAERNPLIQMHIAKETLQNGDPNSSRSVFDDLRESDASNFEAHEGFADASVKDIQRTEDKGDNAFKLQMIKEARKGYLEAEGLISMLPDQRSGYRGESKLSLAEKKHIDAIRVKLDTLSQMQAAAEAYAADPKNFKDFEALGDRTSANHLHGELDPYIEAKRRANTMSTENPKVKKDIDRIDKKISEVIAKKEEAARRKRGEA